MGSDKTLLVAGIAAIAVGLAGMAVSIGSNGGWGESSGSWPGFSHGRMMNWWDGSDHDEPASPVLEGAEDHRIEAGDLFFEPSTVTLRPDTPVNLTLVNEGRLFHDLTIPALGFHVNADPGESTTGGLEAAAPGEYRFECTVPGHAEAGMIGSLIVDG